MAASIEVYTFEDADGVEQEYITQDIREAKDYARRNNLKVIANTYGWSDSEVIEDHTDSADESSLTRYELNIGIREDLTPSLRSELEHLVGQELGCNADRYLTWEFPTEDEAENARHKVKNHRAVIFVSVEDKDDDKWN